MKIQTKTKAVDVTSVLSTNIIHNGKSYPALKFIFPGAITAEDIAALTSGSISIDKNPYDGYTTMGEVTITIGKVTTAEAERDAIQAEHAETLENVRMILPVLDDETALTVKALFPLWKTGENYTIGERVLYGGELFKIVQDHTSQADWIPSGTPSLYDPVVVGASGHDTWTQPTGAHDAYNTGDIVEYNGTLYKCLIDGNTYAPDTYPDGWEIYTE